METTYFYVTCKRDSQTAYLVGPCRDHETALALVDTAREAAERIDPFAAFYAFGTASITWNHKLLLVPDGKLNAIVGFDDATNRIESAI